MPQIITALRGNAMLSKRWASAVKEAGVKDAPIVAVNNAADEEIVNGIGGIAVPVVPFMGGNELARVRYIAALYEKLIRAAKTEWIILWDDDVLPPWKGVAMLIAAARQADAATAGIVTVYPYGDNIAPGYACLFFQPYGAAATESSIPVSGLHEVWGGGTGLSIWRREVLLDCLPFSIPEGTEYGWDRDLAIKLSEKKLKTLAECSIRCRHDTNP